MITAYCDSCGTQIPSEFSAGVRYLFGKSEYSGHLCSDCMIGAKQAMFVIHDTHSLRVVKGE